MSFAISSVLNVSILLRLYCSRQVMSIVSWPITLPRIKGLPCTCSCDQFAIEHWDDH